MNNVKCKYCTIYSNEWCNIKSDSPDPELERNCPHYIVATNFHHIKSMNIDELASYLVKIGWACNNCSEDQRLSDNPLLHYEQCDEKCEFHCKEWLADASPYLL